ncbi:MAG: hypothetical protein AABZ55_02270 [Bdellovibrionota bacterium]
MKLKLGILNCVFVLMTGCATAKAIQGPDGTENQLIRCSYGIENCYNKAAEVCRGKYAIVNNSTNVQGSQGYISSTNEL